MLLLYPQHPPLLHQLSACPSSLHLSIFTVVFLHVNLASNTLTKHLNFSSILVASSEKHKIFSSFFSFFVSAFSSKPYTKAIIFDTLNFTIASILLSQITPYLCLHPLLPAVSSLPLLGSVHRFGWLNGGMSTCHSDTCSVLLLLAFISL